MSILTCAFWPPVCLLWRCLFRSSARFLIGLFAFFEIYFYFILCFGLYLTACRDLGFPTRDWTWAMAVRAWNPNHWTSREVIICRHFLPFHRLSFRFVYSRIRNLHSRDTVFGCTGGSLSSGCWLTVLLVAAVYSKLCLPSCAGVSALEHACLCIISAKIHMGSWKLWPASHGFFVLPQLCLLRTLTFPRRNMRKWRSLR